MLNAFRFFPLLFLSVFLYGQNDTRPVPDGIFPYRFEQHDPEFSEYYLTVAFQNKINAGDSGFVPPCAMILDADGYLTWYMPSHKAVISDLKFFPQINRFGLIAYVNAQKTNYYLLDTNLRIVDSITNSNGIISDAHEFLVLSNGNYVVGGEYDTVMDLRNEVFNQKPGMDSTKVRCFVIQEFDKAHRLVFEWKSIGHIPVTEGYTYLYGYDKKGFDYCHGNAIAEASDGNLLVSFRNLNAIYKIDHHSGKLIWQLGGKHNSFRFANDKGFSGQHDVRMHADGTISLFDNSTALPELKGTRAVEYQLDTVLWTATRTWEYRYDPSVYSPSLGSYQHREDGYRLINYGFVFRPDPSILLLNAQGEISSRIFFPDSIKSYRSYISPAGKYIHRPLIYATMRQGKITLTAEAGHAHYRWSTGDTTASILIEKPGTYQVWVDYGAGMSGSKPVSIETLDGNSPEGAIGWKNSSDIYFVIALLIGLAVLIGFAVGDAGKEKGKE